MWHPAHSGTIPTCVIPVKDPFLLSQDNVELNRWSVTQHTAAKALLLSLQNVTQTVEEEKPEPPTVQEIKQKIEKYNAKVTNCLLMKLVRPGLVSPHTHRLWWFLWALSRASPWGRCHWGKGGLSSCFSSCLAFQCHWQPSLAPALPAGTDLWQGAARKALPQLGEPQRG